MSKEQPTEWEWRKALEHTGLDGIEPHPLAPVTLQTLKRNRTLITPESKLR
jgi:hypothetical protein